MSLIKDEIKYRFFKDYSYDERVKILKTFNILPQNHNGDYLYESTQRGLLMNFLNNLDEYETVYMYRVVPETGWHVCHKEFYDAAWSAPLIETTKFYQKKNKDE